MRLKKKGKVELKQWGEVSLAKYIGMICYNSSYKIYFHKHKTTHFIVIPKNQNIPDTPLRCLKLHSIEVFKC